MTLPSELIDIPEQVHKWDFVISLFTAVNEPVRTVGDHFVTPQLVGKGSMEREPGRFEEALAAPPGSTPPGPAHRGPLAHPLPVPARTGVRHRRRLRAPRRRARRDQPPRQARASADGRQSKAEK